MLKRLPPDFCRQTRRQNAIMLCAFQVLTTKYGGKKTRQDVKFISAKDERAPRDDGGGVNSNIEQFGKNHLRINFYP